MLLTPEATPSESWPSLLLFALASFGFGLEGMSLDDEDEQN
jgi:hypothetical protein